MQSPSSLRFGLCWHIQPNTDVPDLVTWKWTDDGSFSVAFACAIQFDGATCCSFHFSVHSWVIGFQIFSWLAVRGNCLTADNPLKQGWTCNPICSLWRIVPETSVHLLAECSFIRALGHCHLAMSVMRANNDVNLLDQRSDSAYSLPEPHWSVWSTWKERNESWCSEARLFLYVFAQNHRGAINVASGQMQQNQEADRHILRAGLNLVSHVVFTVIFPDRME
jgi:hypothetical protein